MVATRLFRDFFKSEKSGGLVLLFCTVASLVIANFIAGGSYAGFWHQKAGFALGPVDLHLSLEHWINDGLMTIFFLLIGLEIERELYDGELSDIRNAALPLAAAIGGMLLPALVHFAFNNNSPSQSGFGIPMATDIAFALGVLSLVGKKVPLALKIFLTALAIIDDLGAILVIAIFYTSDLQVYYLLGAGAVLAVLILLNRLRVKAIYPYLLLGVVMWYCFLRSGVHATLSGVILAFAISYGDGGERSPSFRLQHILHKPVAFVIAPLFALANTGILVQGRPEDMLLNKNSLGILLGLYVGKPLGILAACWLAIRLKLARMPEGVNWSLLTGAGVLAGIGFTMSIFITLLAFTDPVLILHSKIAILVASLLAGLSGYLLISRAVRHRNVTDETV